MTLSSFIETLRADLDRLLEIDGGQGSGARLQTLLMSQGVWAVVVYRAGQLIYDQPFPVAGTLARLGYKVLSKGVEMATGISVPASAQIGKGFYIGHFGSIHLHPDLVAGERFSVGQGVTVGTRGGGDPGVPRIGDDVYIGTGAKVLGPVVIGDQVSIGANAVVVRDVPSGSVAVGVPAKVLPKR